MDNERTNQCIATQFALNTNKKQPLIVLDR